MVSEEDMSNSESPSRQMTVVDVYDLASVIGKDFERIIDQFGADSVTHLMPKVISALELLEAFASRNERENEEIVGLKTTVTRLETEKVEKKEGRQKFEKELEEIENNYRTEIRQLCEMLTKLQEDNKRLSHNQKVESPTQAVKEDELKVMLTLRENVDRQRDLLKIVQKEADEKAQEIDSLHQQIEKLQRTNKEMVRKNKAIQNQGRSLVEEKADLISLLQEREQLITELHIKLGETEKAKKDLEETKVPGDKTADVGSLTVLTDLRQALRDRFTLSLLGPLLHRPSSGAEDMHGMDRDNVPRFTLAELREVLQEKNLLKARVMELEEELASLRPAPTPSPQPSEKNDDEELVVYGPINREPDEKLFPWKYQRKDSGVRKFLQNMFQKREQKKRAASSSLIDENRAHFNHSNSSSNSCGGAWTPSSVSSSKTPVVATARYRVGTSSSQHRRQIENVNNLNGRDGDRHSDNNNEKERRNISSPLVDQCSLDSSSLDCTDEPIEFSLNDDSSSYVSFDNSLDAGRRNSSSSTSSLSSSLKTVAKFKR